MWKAAGLTDADYPQTWDELLEVAKKLTKSDGSQYGIALPDLGWAPFLKGNGTGIYTTDGKVSINTKENKAFLEKMRDFYKGGYSVSGMDETAARESFESGQSAMVIVGPWEDQASTDKGINHDLFPVPNGDGTYVYPDGTKAPTPAPPVCTGGSPPRLATPLRSRHLRLLQVLQQPRQPGDLVPRLRLPAEQHHRHRR